MPDPGETPRTIYSPQPGDLVRDLATGQVGEYQATLDKEVFIRPPGGGCEWTTHPTKVEPVTPADDLAPVDHHPHTRAVP